MEDKILRISIDINTSNLVLSYILPSQYIAKDQSLNLLIGKTDKKLRTKYLSKRVKLNHLLYIDARYNGQGDLQHGLYDYYGNIWLNSALLKDEYLVLYRIDPELLLLYIKQDIDLIVAEVTQ